MNQENKKNEIKYPNLEFFNKLADVESINFEVFIGNTPEEEDLCNLILSFSLIYNDFKDLLYGFDLLEKRKPKICFSKYSGQYLGIRFHFKRLIESLFFELAQLIKEEKKTICSEGFQKILRFINKENKKNWDIIFKFADNQFENNFLTILGRVRNNISFHYLKPKALKIGYKKHFDKKTRSREVACVSRGEALISTRFYFADAAINGWYEEYIPNPEKFEKNIEIISKKTIMSLYDIIESFIETKGGAWYKENVDE